MQALKNALLPTLVILLAALMVILMLWGVSKSGIGDRMRNVAGRDIVASTDTTATTGTAAQASTQDNVRAIASFVKVTILGFIKVTVFMGIPGILTVMVIKQMKR